MLENQLSGRYHEKRDGLTPSNFELNPESQGGFTIMILHAVAMGPWALLCAWGWEGREGRRRTMMKRRDEE